MLGFSSQSLNSNNSNYMLHVYYNGFSYEKAKRETDVVKLGIRMCF